jgi:hypothetical protein
MPSHNVELDDLISQFAGRLEEAIQQEVSARLTAALASTGKRGAFPEIKASLRKTPTATTGKRLCRYPGCSNPSAGPWYRYYCRTHGTRVGAKVVIEKPAPAVVELPQKRAATVLPSSVQITRLPPGPVPGSRRSRDESLALCRLPGCLEKHSGPRYDLFCREHYAKFNKDERQKYKDIWKEQHARA